MNTTLQRFCPSNYFQRKINAVSIKVNVRCPILSIKLVVLITGKSKKPSTSQSFHLSVCNPTRVKSWTGLDSAIKMLQIKVSFQEINVNKPNQSTEKKEVSLSFNFSEGGKNLLLKGIIQQK